MEAPRPRLICRGITQAQLPGLVNDVVRGRQKGTVQGDDISGLQELLLGDIGDTQPLELLALIQIVGDHL